MFIESVRVTRRSTVGFTSLVACLVACSIGATGCCEKALKDAQINTDEAVSKAKAECDPVKADLATVKADLATAKVELATLRVALAAAQTENTKLRQTPRFYFDQAVAKMAASDSDPGDSAAIAAFQHVADRFPGDLLVEEAQKKIKELNGRIAGRARALAKAQAQVRRLIQVCRSNSRSAEAISQDGFRFNDFGQMDMNLLLDTGRRSDPLWKRARKAKEQAEELLKTVPDPDGKLMEQVDKCDDTES
jgi:hypothetical protein